MKGTPALTTREQVVAAVAISAERERITKAVEAMTGIEEAGPGYILVQKSAVLKIVNNKEVTNDNG